MKDIKLGKYRHYKGKEYEVIGVARHSESLQRVVVYRTLYQTPEFGKNSLWVLPVAEFLEQVTVNGQKAPRFAYLGK